jgi:hypothetical protein
VACINSLDQSRKNQGVKPTGFFGMLLTCNILRRTTMPAPHIKTAIPLQRHQIGSFVATVLGDSGGW